MAPADMWALAVATVVVVAPGAALLAALRVRRPLWWIALPVPASVGVATVTAIGCAALGVRFGPVPLGLVTVALGLLGALGLPASVGARRGAGEWRAEWRARGDRLPGLALVAAGVGLGVLVWVHGLGGMGTIGQEHDLIVHGVLTAYIQESGHGAPWQLLPADVLTGGGVTFYPAGLHLLMAVTATITGSTIVGINAVSAIALGAGWTSGSAALAHVAARRARLDPAPALVAAGIAAVVAAGLYRPTISLAQWGGTIPNAATLALTPGLLAALLTLPALPTPPRPRSRLLPPRLCLLRLPHARPTTPPTPQATALPTPTSHRPPNPARQRARAPGRHPALNRPAQPPRPEPDRPLRHQRAWPRPPDHSRPQAP
jgi:hypothetical protein